MADPSGRPADGARPCQQALDHHAALADRRFVTHEFCRGVKKIGGHTVRSVGGGAVFACLGLKIRAAAARETQVARQAELNHALRVARATLSAAEADL